MDSNLSFEDLLKTSGSVSIHNRNLQLAVEIYKALKKFVFIVNVGIILGKGDKIVLEIKNHWFRISLTIKYGLNTITQLAPKIWEKSQ